MRSSEYILFSHNLSVIMSMCIIIFNLKTTLLFSHSLSAIRGLCIINLQFEYNQDNCTNGNSNGYTKHLYNIV